MGTGGIDELASVLGRERRLLEFLLFKLTTARLLLESDDRRFLPWAAAEVERAAQRVRQLELVRATLVAAVATGPEEGATLADLAEHSDDPWRSILREQRDELVRLLEEINRITDLNRSLAFDGIKYIAELMEMIQLGLGTATSGSVP